jgi:ABC-type proline/glycine betaine transport system substrate-binding protein
MYLNEYLRSIRIKEKKRMENIVLVEDTATGTMVEQKITKEDIDSVRNEKSRKKCEAFMNFTPKSKGRTLEQDDVRNSKVTDYFEKAPTKMVDMSQSSKNSNRGNKKGGYSLSKIDLIF